MTRFCMALLLLAGLCAQAPAQEAKTRDHRITVTSTVPVITGRKSMLYLRERALPQVCATARATRWCCSCMAPARPPK